MIRTKMEISAAILRGAMQYPRTHRPWKNDTLPPRSCECRSFELVGRTTWPRNTCLGLHSHGQSTDGADGNDAGKDFESTSGFVFLNSNIQDISVSSFKCFYRIMKRIFQIKSTLCKLKWIKLTSVININVRKRSGCELSTPRSGRISI